MCFANCHKGFFFCQVQQNFVVASCMTTTNSVFSTYKRMWVSRAVLSCQVFSCHPPSPPFSLSLLLQVTCRITRRFVLSGRMRRKIRSSPIRLLSIRETLINLIVICAGVPCQSTFYTFLRASSDFTKHNIQRQPWNHGKSHEQSKFSMKSPRSLMILIWIDCNQLINLHRSAAPPLPTIVHKHHMQNLAFQWKFSFGFWSS